MANTFSPASSNPLPPSGSFGGAGLGGFNPPPVGGAGGKPNKNQIITALYKSILGRDPDPNALMYYISQPEINEDAVRKQMVESEEHKTILAEYKNIEGLKKEIEGLKSQLQIKDKAIADKQVEIEQMNTILHHKSQEITRVKDELAQLQRNPEQQVVTTSAAPETVSTPAADVGFKKVVKDILKSLFG